MNDHVVVDNHGSSMIMFHYHMNAINTCSWPATIVCTSILFSWLMFTWYGSIMVKCLEICSRVDHHSEPSGAIKSFQPSMSHHESLMVGGPLVGWSNKVWLACWRRLVAGYEETLTPQSCSRIWHQPANFGCCATAILCFYSLDAVAALCFPCVHVFGFVLPMVVPACEDCCSSCWCLLLTDYQMFHVQKHPLRPSAGWWWGHWIESKGKGIDDDAPHTISFDHG